MTQKCDLINRNRGFNKTHYFFRKLFYFETFRSQTPPLLRPSPLRLRHRPGIFILRRDPSGKQFARCMSHLGACERHAHGARSFQRTRCSWSVVAVGKHFLQAHHLLRPHSIFNGHISTLYSNTNVILTTLSNSYFVLFLGVVGVCGVVILAARRAAVGAAGRPDLTAVAQRAGAEFA